MTAPRRETVLFVCTANQCRSPMAEALFRRQVAGRSEITVTSAGFLPPGVPCPQETLEVMEEVGVDLSAHRSGRLAPEMVAASSLVVTMTRQHLIDLALEFPTEWERCFTISGLLERATAIDPRGSGEELGSWVSRVNAGRQRADLLRLSTQGDIPDPIGGPVRAFRRVRDQLTGLAAALADLVVRAEYA